MEKRYRKEKRLLKSSRYNFFVETGNDDVIAFNARTGSLGIMSINNYNDYLSWINKDMKLDLELNNQLFQTGFIIDSNVDEKQLIKYDLNKSRYSNGLLLMMITPTLECNFNCPYCFENGNRSGKMDEETVEELIDFIKAKVVDHKEINIAWSGGEPLLEWDLIREISSKIIPYCESKDIVYSASIITNGYLLNRVDFLELEECKISKIQITLDGEKEEHNKKRLLHNGKGTFDIIMKNIIDYSKFLPILIRVNVDKNNIESARSLFKSIKSIGSPNINISPAPIKSYNSKDEDSYLTNDEFAALSFELYIQSIENKSFKPEIPVKVDCVCDADYEHSYVIDSNGHLYKCWSDIGNIPLSFGSIKENIFRNKGLFLEYMSYDATEDKMCSECPVLPLCMGGCPAHRLKNANRCSKYKDSLEKYLKIAYQLNFKSNNL